MRQRLLLAVILFALSAALWAVMPARAGEQVPRSTRDLQMTFSPLVKKTAPAVVNIYAKRLVRERMALISPFMNDPFFNQFFGRQLAPGGTRERVENSLGSGVIVDPAGFIATNSHVIGQATEIIVVMADGREYTAEKVLSDDQTDLAILRIDAKGAKLPHLPLADSDLLEVGDIVLAIGNPFGLGQTVTSGIVSGLSRTGVGPSEYGFFIQTDAAINPGNSGGALVDVDGALIGINSMIFSRTGASHGIGFAIPANMVRTVVDTARAGGKTVVRPWTGFTGQTVTSDMLETLGLNRAYGVLVNKVRAGGPAERAGLKVGDVITAINGIEVRDPQSLHFRLAVAGLG
jgi:serine protease Do